MEEFTLADYKAIFMRWKDCFFGSFFVLLLFVTILSLSWSNYRSTAVIEIEQPKVDSTVTTPTGMNPNDVPEDLVDLRIAKIQEKITSPTAFSEIIKKVGLYQNVTDPDQLDALAADLAKKVKVDLKSSPIANPAASAKVSLDQLSATSFTLSFDYSNPVIAQKVASELVDRFLSEDLSERLQDAGATSKFLDDEIKALEGSLAEQEAKIAAFKNDHGISGPEAVMFNQQAAASTSLTMQNVDAQIASNEGTQGSIRAQLSTVDPYSRMTSDGQFMTTPAVQLKALEAQYAALTAQYSPDYPDVIKVKHQIESLRKEVGSHGSSSNTADTAELKSKIEDIKTNLAVAEQSYGPDNPDVLSLKNQLKSLNGQLAAQKNSTTHGDLKKDADNPAYLALVSQLNSLEEQHKSLVDQRSKLAEQQAKYESALAKDPALEQEMDVLARDHDNAELRYRDLKERKMTADMNVKMLEDHQGEQLVVITPPDLPAHTHPRSSVLFIAGFIFSIIGGLGVVVLIQIIKPTIIGARQLTALVGVAPLVVIPHIYTQSEKKRSWQHISLQILRTLTKRALTVTQSKENANG
jgi:uncharacterized protein involved in exopolysaccharide biosynthesis